MEYVKNIFSELFDTRLEEVELSDDGKNWFITVSFIRQLPAMSVAEKISMINSGINPSERDYKLITVDAETGEVRSMKIRQLV